MISEAVLYLTIYLKGKKCVYRFLDKDEFENTILSQKHPSPIPFKTMLSCSAPPANILPAAHFGWYRGLP